METSTMTSGFWHVHGTSPLCKSTSDYLQISVSGTKSKSDLSRPFECKGAVA